MLTSQFPTAHDLHLPCLGVLRICRPSSPPRRVGFFTYTVERTDLFSGCFCCCLFAIGLATTAYFHTDAANKTALAMLLLWVISYGSSSGPLGFVAAGETSTPRLRAKTTAFCMMCYGIGFVTFTWSVSYMISPDAANMGVKAIYIWAGMLVPTTVLLYLYYPEVSSPSSGVHSQRS